MGKPSRERVLAENEARAVNKMLKTSPQKLNIVAAMSRGNKVRTARADPTFARQRISVDPKQALESHIPHAVTHHSHDVTRRS